MITPVTVDDLFISDTRRWLEQKAAEYQLIYLLVHADDGVIWGKVNSTGSLVIFGDLFSEVAVLLRADTLQQARLFGPIGELLVWRVDEEQFNGRFFTDSDIPSEDIIEQNYPLWGEGSDPPGTIQGFTLLQEGLQGYRHVIPLSIPRGGHADLTVHHIIHYDEEQGEAYIALSRLVDVQALP